MEMKEKERKKIAPLSRCTKNKGKDWKRST
jgi:hypothetical protein